MERGAHSVGFSVIGMIFIVAVLASATLIYPTITGNVAQGDPIYHPADINLPCKAILLKTNSISNTYCCLSDMVGQNTCKKPYILLKAQ